MNRRLRMLLVLAIALVCATIATGGVMLYIQRRPPVTKPEPTVDLVVAAKDVPQGNCLTDADLKVVKWPAKMPVAGKYDDPKKVAKRGLIAAVLANEPITDAKLAKANEGCGLPPSIKKDMRAISVRVNEVIGVAGFVVPGAKVDVVVTIRGNAESTSRVIVSNAEVLTAGTRYDQQQAKDGKPIPTTVVTLMVTPDNAERIALAATEGQILLTLRNPTDADETRTSGITTPVLLRGGVATPRPAAPSGRGRASGPMAPPPPPAAPGPYEVMVFKGGKPTKEVVATKEVVK